MSINKPDVGDLFYEAFMEALAEEAAPPKKESNKQFSNTTIQTPAEFESCKFKGSTCNPLNKSNYRFHNCCFDNCSFED